MKRDYEVIVMGSGSAGSIAALASARQGAKTLLIEESFKFGGTNTKALVGPIVPFMGEFKQQIVDGIPQEIIDELIKMNASIGHIDDPIGFAHSLTIVDFNTMQLVLSKKMTDQKNLDIAMGESVVGIKENNNKISSIITSNQYGEEKEYTADVFIDSTGDADVIALSDSPVERGRERDGLCQPMTMVFSVGGVDLEKVRDDVHENPKNFVINDALKEGQRMEYIAISGYLEEVAKSDDFPIVRDRLLFFQGIQEDEVYMNTTRILNKNNLIEKEYNEAVLEGHKQVLELHAWMKHNIEAFKNSYIKDVGEIGVRESRRIVGIQRLESENVLKGEKQKKSIAVGSYPIDIHSPDSSMMEFLEENRIRNYEIDLDMIRPINLKNVMVAGRAISATHEAHASSRVSATCMAIGQSAGVIAALSAMTGKEIDDLDYDTIKTNIVNMGGVVDRKAE